MIRYLTAAAVVLTLMLAQGPASAAETTATEADGVAPASLQDTTWTLVALNDAGVTETEPMEPHLTLMTAGNRAAGYAGCNRFSGAYTLDGDKLKFSPLAVTRRMCPQGMDTEMAYLQALQSTTAWRIAGNKLELLDGTGKAAAAFEAR